MLTRFSPNYSLWPERPRPLRSTPLTRAVGGFLVGVVCAIAAYCAIAIAGYNVVADVVRLATVQEPGAQSVVEHVTFPAPAVAPAATPAPAPLETVSRGSRTRARAAKVTLPIIGSQAALPSAATDGRGGDELASGATVAAFAASSEDPASLIREEGEAVPPPPAQETGADEAKPAAATEGPVKPRKQILREKRERPTSYAARYSHKRERPTRYVARYRQRERPTRYAAGQYRQGPISIGLVSQTASWY